MRVGAVGRHTVREGQTRFAFAYDCMAFGGHGRSTTVPICEGGACCEVRQDSLQCVYGPVVRCRTFHTPCSSTSASSREYSSDRKAITAAAGTCLLMLCR